MEASNTTNMPFPKTLYIESLRLSGYRAIKDETTLDFSMDNKIAQWTVLLGENGTAKTAILKAISAMSPVLKDESKDEDEISWLPRGTGESRWVNWWQSNRSQNSKSSGDHTSLSLQFATSHSGLSNTFSSKKTQWKADFEFIDTSRKVKTDILAPQHDEVESFLPLNVLSFTANRLTARQSENGSETQNGISIFRDYTVICSPEIWLLELHHAMMLDGDATDKSKAVDAFESVKQCILKILPDVEDLKIERGPKSGLTNPQIAVRFLSPFGWVTFDQLGLGYQSIASWCIALLKTLYDKYHGSLSEPETGPAIVLIDEFDLHLHPKWQLSLMGTLGAFFKNTQFIITTHSPLIVQGIPENSKVILLQKEEDESGVNWITANSDPVRVRGWRLDQLVSSDLFGATSRPKDMQVMFKRRFELISKPILNDEEQAEFEQLDRILKQDAPASLSEETLAALELLKK